MSPSATHVDPLTLDPATFYAMVSSILDALPHHPRASPEEIASQEQAAFRVISSLRPRDPLEAMLAARIIVAHAHVMGDLRNAAQPGLPPNLQLRFHGRAVAMSRLIDVGLRGFWDLQTAPARQPQGLPAPAVPTVRPETEPEASRTVQPAAPSQANAPHKTTSAAIFAA